MNTFRANEQALAEKLRQEAYQGSCAYCDNPGDLAAARLAALMIACQQEARAQGITAQLVFSHEAQE